MGWLYESSVSIQLIFSEKIKVQGTTIKAAIFIFGQIKQISLVMGHHV